MNRRKDRKQGIRLIWKALRAGITLSLLLFAALGFSFLLHPVCVATAWKINDFCCQCPMKYYSLWHHILVTWLWILTAKQCPSQYQQVFVHQVESHAVSGIVLLVSMFYIPVMLVLCTMLIYANKFVYCFWVYTSLEAKCTWLGFEPCTWLLIEWLLWSVGAGK
jgi:hypothetical protein